MSPTVSSRRACLSSDGVGLTLLLETGLDEHPGDEYPPQPYDVLPVLVVPVRNVGKES